MDPNVSTKIQEYETFLNDTLKEDLKLLEKKLIEVNNKLADWYILKKTINDIREHHSTGYKTFVDIGCGILCQAKVPNVSVINVNIGLNVYLKMTFEDANKFCDLKINVFKKDVEHIQTQSIKVKAHIKLLLLGLQELQRI